MISTLMPVYYVVQDVICFADAVGGGQSLVGGCPQLAHGRCITLHYITYSTQQGLQGFGC
jgi:hypothetical protein